ncbi:lytic transglycosylase domain-containing protein [Methylobacterium symbioticum]|uniref:lytic transglycosylase domain-containing protein n=1 Tax=uncultured Methylobacterium sp. TaxID=157278 RepID=UPI002597777A|nr:transglycosylase SLT domain-containing protein [uncultured Methylobacterium sp.]
MFLFTTPSTPREPAPPATAATRAAPAGVVDAIRDGAKASGVGFDYLLATAQRESAFDPAAKAGTSSATGLFQFIEQTWLGVMKNAGSRLGLSSYADAITARPDGTYAVADPAARQTILDLRRDPKVSAALAGALTQKNGEALAAALGREPSSGDLYAAHVLGARGATALITAARDTPDRPAALDLPEAAAANRALFYDKAGRPRSVSELYASLSATARGVADVALQTQASGLPQATTSYAASAYAAGADLRSLFQTDRRAGPVAQGLTRLWQGRPDGAPAAAPGARYFPRSEPGADSIVAAVAEPEAVVAAGAVIVNPPLPPRRPAELAAASPAQAAASLRTSLYLTRSGP